MVFDKFFEDFNYRCSDPEDQVVEKYLVICLLSVCVFWICLGLVVLVLMFFNMF